jgi:MFS family permease
MQSYLLLFVGDAVSSVITAAIVLVALRETRPEAPEGAPEPTLAQTFAGYLTVLRHGAFVWFLGAFGVLAMVYWQMYTTLSVYLGGTHGVTERGYGLLLSLNAALVVLFQFPIARRTSRRNPALVMAVGTALFAIGYGFFGLTDAYLLFLGAMGVVTLGEMFVMPVGMAIVAQLAPEQMRGRYLATFNLTWVSATVAGPFLAGIVLDNTDPRLVWLLAFSAGLAAASAFLQLAPRLGGPKQPAPPERRLAQAAD